MRKRRAVSPLLAVIILIGITVVGGVIVNDSLFNILGSALTQIEYKVTDLRLEKNAEGSCYFSIGLFNSGTEIIKRVNVKTTLDNGEDWIFEFENLGDGLAPHDTTSVFEQIPFTNDAICGNFTLSNIYSISINASSVVSSSNILKAIKVGNVTQT